jgi:hypothetical protein
MADRLENPTGDIETSDTPSATRQSLVSELDRLQSEATILLDWYEARLKSGVIDTEARATLQLAEETVESMVAAQEALDRFDRGARSQCDLQPGLNGRVAEL